MNIKFLGTKGTWREIANSANTTINKEEGTKEPSSSWKRKMLLCEHSPIRQLIIKWKWYDLKYWVSVHFCRHFIGIVHWVRTQRSDRTNVNRDTEDQGSKVEHECEANAQSLINISRKRLCACASKETREAWMEVLKQIKEIEPELYAVCVKNCIYRGWCYEHKSCGYHLTPDFKIKLDEYRKNINYQIPKKGNIMPDITMCNNKDCKLKLECWRYMSKADPHYQSYLVEYSSCNEKNNYDLFWEMDEYKLKNIDKDKLNDI